MWQFPKIHFYGDAQHTEECGDTLPMACNPKALRPFEKSSLAPHNGIPERTQCVLPRFATGSSAHSFRSKTVSSLRCWNHWLRKIARTGAKQCPCKNQGPPLRLAKRNSKSQFCLILWVSRLLLLLTQWNKETWMGCCNGVCGSILGMRGFFSTIIALLVLFHSA